MRFSKILLTLLLATQLLSCSSVKVAKIALFNPVKDYRTRAVQPSPLPSPVPADVHGYSGFDAKTQKSVTLTYDQAAALGIVCLPVADLDVVLGALKAGATLP